MIKIAIGSDHAGFIHKRELAEWLRSRGYQVEDYGAFSEESTDYPDYAVKVAHAVANGDCQMGILLCGTGIGMAITANKVAGIRAANCCSVEMARLAREHNDANILTLGARLLSVEEVKEITAVFLQTPFAGGRHLRRVKKITQLTGC